MQNLPKTFEKYRNPEYKAGDIVFTNTYDGNAYSGSQSFVLASFDALCGVMFSDVARFVESHQNDFLISYMGIIEDIKEMSIDETHVEFLALRKNGVDGNIFLLENLKSKTQADVEQYYRSVFCVTYTKRIDEYGFVVVDVNVRRTSVPSFEEDDREFSWS